MLRRLNNGRTSDLIHSFTKIRIENRTKKKSTRLGAYFPAKFLFHHDLNQVVKPDDPQRTSRLCTFFQIFQSRNDPSQPGSCRILSPEPASLRSDWACFLFWCLIFRMRGFFVLVLTGKFRNFHLTKDWHKARRSVLFVGCTGLSRKNGKKNKQQIPCFQLVDMLDFRAKK